MAGIYIHIPFCKQACHYCNFHFSTQQNGINDFVKALLNEIKMRAAAWSDTRFETIYFGGGTPSLLPISSVEIIVETLYKYYEIIPDAEFTMECNPDDIQLPLLHVLRKVGVNRLSIGVQSFHDKHLLLMNRSHCSAQAINAVKDAQDAGFDNITVDLIYGLPQLTLHEWEDNLLMVERLQVPHLSCYSLTVEERTALAHFLKTKSLTTPDEDDTIRQYNSLLDWSERCGILQYEISNFAKNGFESRHNSNYWKRKPYLGLGPSAHSFKNGIRSMNQAHNIAYTKRLLNEQLPESTSETLTEKDEYNETIMLQMRTVAGLNKNSLLDFSKPLQVHFHQQLASLTIQDLLRESGDYISLTREGQMLSDYIISQLFFTE